MTVTVSEESVLVTAPVSKPVVIDAGKGAPGPPGKDGQDALWVSMTQAAFDALPVKDPNTLYVIVG